MVPGDYLCMDKEDGSFINCDHRSWDGRVHSKAHLFKRHLDIQIYIYIIHMHTYIHTYIHAVLL